MNHRTVLSLVLTALLALTACSSHGTRAATPRHLTSEEADRMALARFTAYRRGTGEVTATVPSRGRTVTLSGRIDWRGHHGYAELRDDAAPPTRELVHWSTHGVASRPRWTGGLPDLPPASGWEVHPLQPHSAALDSMLLLLLHLGSDRPDNAQLLARSDARWLREDRIDGVPVMVAAGPGAPGTPAGSGRLGNTRYWIDADGRLLRFQARLGGEAQWANAELHRTPSAKPLPDPPAQLTGAGSQDR
ncbi:MULTISPECIES: hypothetical protein [Streptomyces]|uniref:Lipoprotein n=1 Tax=Streptomyces virginiae TaxID=1961 RepID=A0ABQ3NL44_STRVG|nr:MULTISPECIES: hypothetical protein [Streptomyces]MBP2342617.1 hypothetical protein [Streptomyces virginiae]GGQ20094.1 hypothetical protein GCM10010215_50880 [Streptomyces virginiae]GHI13496.1 hypothetical protein Scinn_29590 [Streptomyces virginiae]GLV95084.1 hypothetical protein Slala04_65370 [Streptomyces lavendulae subsp. lavendulae]